MIDEGFFFSGKMVWGIWERVKGKVIGIFVYNLDIDYDFTRVFLSQ